MQKVKEIRQEAENEATGSKWKDSNKAKRDIMYEFTVQSSAIDRVKLAHMEKRCQELESLVEDDRYDFIQKKKQYNTKIAKLKEAKASERQALEARLNATYTELQQSEQTVKKLEEEAELRQVAPMDSQPIQ